MSNAAKSKWSYIPSQIIESVMYLLVFLWAISVIGFIATFGRESATTYALVSGIVMILIVVAATVSSMERRPASEIATEPSITPE